MSARPKPSLPTQTSHLIPDLPVRRNTATTAEALGVAAGGFAQVLFWVIFLGFFCFLKYTPHLPWDFAIQGQTLMLYNNLAITMPRSYCTTPGPV